MNNNIYKKTLTTHKKVDSDGSVKHDNKHAETKSHQAFFMEFSRMKPLKEKCLQGDCNEFNSLGGDVKFNELQNLVQNQQNIDKINKKARKDTDPNNPYQKEKPPTEVSVPKVTKSADHSGGEVNKILTNNQALNEEIESIKYLIEYMNNNKKQNL